MKNERAKYLPGTFEIMLSECDNVLNKELENPYFHNHKCAKSLKKIRTCASGLARTNRLFM